MCRSVEKSLKEEGMYVVLEKYTAPDFNIGFYEAPG